MKSLFQINLHANRSQLKSAVSCELFKASYPNRDGNFSLINLPTGLRFRLESIQTQMAYYLPSI